jgi:roadblock/LC7 domain-containing protein
VAWKDEQSGWKESGKCIGNETYMVTRLAWIAAKLVSSKRETRYASAASWSAMTAEDWKRRSVYVGNS